MEGEIQNLVIRIPASILELDVKEKGKEVGFLDKLILSVGYTFQKKLGHNSLSNKDLSIMLGVDETSLGKHRKRLVELGYERKEGRKYILTDKVNTQFTLNKREILLPQAVYSIKKLDAGAKLLFAEYNSLSSGDQKECRAKREYLANRLKCSVDSISNWFKKLDKLNLFSHTELRYGANSRQRVIVTKKDFNNQKEKKVESTVKGKDTTLESLIDSEKKEVSKIEEVQEVQKEVIISVEHSEDEKNWRKYMYDIHTLDLTDKGAVEKYVWKVDEKINDREEDRDIVFQSLLNHVDVKYRKADEAELLKEEIKSYIEEGDE
jgi:Mn-dependent DtxR family transcriptional regulator